MFIRKRVQKLKNGKISVTYQAVESYRIGKKVKQRIVSLGEFSDPRTALENESVYLKNAEKNYKYPLSEWYEIRIGPGNQQCRVKLNEKQALKKRNFWRKIYQGHLKRIGQLDYAVSKFQIDGTKDTTNDKKREDKIMAEDNHRKIMKLIGG
ncbi:MAG: hypothetical protein Q8K92_12245 [Leadbetterella sp.]|nr:hypothetical protein [Leadbetterella sp.]